MEIDDPVLYKSSESFEISIGYGQTGPYRQHAGYDVIVEGEAGLMHITGEPYPAKPVKV